MKFFSKSKNKKMTQIKLLDNFIELSEDDLRFKVNGGAALSPQQQYELSQQTSQGDFSGYNHLVSDGNTGSSGGTSDSYSGSSQSSSSRSSSNTTRSSNIDQRESSDPSSSSNNTQNPGYNPDYSSYNPDPGKEGENESGYEYTNVGNLTKDKDQNWEMQVDYTKNGSNNLAVTVRTRNKDGTYDYSNGKVMTVMYSNTTNKVTPKEERAKPISYPKSVPEDQRYNYYPVQFPDGDWKITGVVNKSNDLGTYGPWAVKTNAHTTVDTYNKDGTEVVGKKEDYGYMVHTGSYSTTWGCLKMENDSKMMDFASLTYKMISSGADCSISVRDANKLFA